MIEQVVGGISEGWTDIGEGWGGDIGDGGTQI